MWSVASSLASEGSTVTITASGEQLLSEWPCNMKTIDTSALSFTALVDRMASAAEPLLLTNLAEWRIPSHSQLLLDHGNVRLNVVRNKTITNNYVKADYETSLGDFLRGIRNGSVPRDDYVFTEAMNTSIEAALPDLGDLYASVCCRRDRECCRGSRAARGAHSLICGGHGSGNGFHAHGPALNMLLLGRKHWVVQRPEARLSSEGTAQDIAGMSVDQALGDHMALLSWAREFWRCTQAPGQLVWVPDELFHATANEGTEVVALTTLFNFVGGSSSMSPLQEAAGGGLVDEVRSLLAAGAPVSGVNGDGRELPSWGSPLHAAAAAAQVEVVRVLLEAGADAGMKATGMAGTPLHVASSSEHSASPNALGDPTQDMQHHVSRQAQIVRMLLDAGAPINSPNREGATALHDAAYNGNTEVARVLLEAGANVAGVARRGTPLHYAAHQGHAEVARVLLEAGAPVGTGNGHAGTPLHLAAYGGHAKLARVLLEAGEPVDATHSRGGTPLHTASNGGHVEVVLALLEAGAPVSAPNRQGGTPLHDASHGGHTEVVRLLLQAGAAVDAKLNEGTTALDIAADAGRTEVVRLLQEARGAGSKSRRR